MSAPKKKKSLTLKKKKLNKKLFVCAATVKFNVNKLNKLIYF
jgi:hypothetical protein